MTFDEWNTCVVYGECDPHISDASWGRGQQPVINVTFDDAQRYVAWLSKMTGKPYRLLTEAEYEYATRAGKQTAYPWGDTVGKNNANCGECGSQWDKQGRRRRSVHSHPTGSVSMTWLAMFGSGSKIACTSTITARRRMVRRGSKAVTATTDASVVVPLPAIPQELRSASFFAPSSGFRESFVGFRIGRTLLAP